MHRASGDTALTDSQIPTPRRPTRQQIGHRLHRDWQRLRRRPDALLRAAGWDVVSAPLADLDDVLAAIGFEVAESPAAEAALRSLVVRSADDQLAARVVLQRLLPGLLACARRRGQVADAADELIGAAWIAITTFNPARTPRCLAAALLADADYRAFRYGWRRAAPNGEVPIDVADDVEQPAILAVDDELAELFATALASGVPADEVAFLRRLLDARSPDDVAAELSVTARTVRNRRARATDRLREFALVA